MRRSPMPSTAAGRPCSNARSPRPAGGLGDGRDGRAWRRLFGPLARDAGKLAGDCSGRSSTCRVTRWPWRGSGCRRCARRMAWRAAGSGDEAARALFAGLAAHAMLRLDRPLSASFGLVLGMYAHAVGWPMVRGGAAAVADALAAELRAPGGEIVTGRRSDRSTTSRRPAPSCSTRPPRRWSAIAGDRLAAADPPPRTSASGTAPGVFKLDWALDGPDPVDRRRAAPRGHGPPRRHARRGRRVGGRGRRRPPSATGRSRCSSSTPRGTRLGRRPGKTTAWAYCHVPSGSDGGHDRPRSRPRSSASRPGFRDRILARSTHGPAAMEAHDANYVGGDINAGIQDIRQLLFRPWPCASIRTAPGPGLYLCSSSTPPGGGVHGMSGLLAARSALRHDLALERPASASPSSRRSHKPRPAPRRRALPSRHEQHEQHGQDDERGRRPALLDDAGSHSSATRPAVAERGATSAFAAQRVLFVVEVVGDRGRAGGRALEVGRDLADSVGGVASGERQGC